MRKKYISFCIAMLCCFLLVNTSFAQQTVNQSGLKHWMTAEELLRKGEIGKNFVETNPPTGTIRNIAEFDKMEKDSPVTDMYAMINVADRVNILMEIINIISVYLILTDQLLKMEFASTLIRNTKIY